MKQQRTGSIVALLVIGAVLSILLYLYNAPMFERTAPEITLEETIHWNLKEPIALHVKDQSGVKFVRVTLNDGTNSVVLHTQMYTAPQKELSLEVAFPRTGFFSKEEQMTLEVEAVDASKWNFFAGNEAQKIAQLHIDTTRPELFVLTNSYKITKGGSAAVVFRGYDANMEELYIQTNDGQRFYPAPFYKEGYYISLVAWPRREETFHADIIAKDKAGNFSRERVRFFLQNRKYRVSSIALTERFLEGKVTDLAQMYSREYETMRPIERFMFVNKTLRQDNDAQISHVATQAPQALLGEAKLNPFYPLRNGAAVASFGDHRKYTYEGQIVSESYHLGLDLASTAQAEILSSNDGRVVFAQETGIYGRTVILDHGLGLYTLYSHCSSLLVQEGDVVKAGDVIAKTGATGFAFGDHLHFGVLVQGVEVRPEEWMDKNWMEDNLYAIMRNAKALIERQ
ncbi:M23 family metallopeptidase [Sulfurospirillum sp. T05]|uniref:M23 family metallopeptidase n=1 Tax=Sulfurospirillum tamanense TaxID=2813362 RepID=A0ABS2WPB8_9BACT|nr:M23 family metallopeptidase [Sulfurospirillum tamanensis]MBN2963448.1 M23 family metallopeptidase [Sulfurospirillum tamanensis]